MQTCDGGALNGKQGTVRVPCLFTGAGASAADHDPSAGPDPRQIQTANGANAFWRFYVTTSKPTGELLAEVVVVDTASAQAGGLVCSRTSRH